MTYIDKDWSQGNSFRKAGFELAEETKELWFWVDPITHKRELLNDAVELPEGALKIANSGNYKFILDLRPWK